MSTQGAMKAADIIRESIYDFRKVATVTTIEQIAEIIDRETHAREMIESLKKIAIWDFDIMGDCVADAQALAKEALKKAGVL